MTTITLQIGNSDEKLSQAEWHRYVEEVRELIEKFERVEGRARFAVHFFGAPPNWAPWQNAAWVFAAEPGLLPALREDLAGIRGRFRQESVAWTEGATEFL